MTHVLVPCRSAGRARRLGRVGLFDEIDRVFEELWRGLGGLPVARVRAPGAFAPPVDVAETEAEFRVSAELPGHGEHEIEVALEDGVLRIRGERKAAGEDGEPGRGLRHVESQRGVFHRAIRLPAEVDEEGVRAMYKAGILTVTLPKRPPVEPEIRSIPITSA